VRAGTFHKMALNIVTQYREDHHLKAFTLEPNDDDWSRPRVQLRDSGDLKLEEWQLHASNRRSAGRSPKASPARCTSRAHAD